MKNKFNKIASIITVIILLTLGILSVFADSKVQTDKAASDAFFNVNGIESQIDELVEKVANETNFKKDYVDIILKIPSKKIIYTNFSPDVYNDLTSELFAPPITFEGVSANYVKAPFATPRKDFDRPSAYYLPDALYSVTLDVKKLMDERREMSRDNDQIFFDILEEDKQEDIFFYEAMLLYTGASPRAVNQFYKAYENVLSNKEKNENVVEYSNKKFKIKNKFSKVFKDNGFKDKDLEYLAILLSYDKDLANSNSIESIQTKFDVPYELNYTSRENMMVAAACLCGKVRYVWGGGHSGASHIDGINPIWKRFEALYPDEKTSISENGVEITNTGFGTCIKPSGSWCPIHGKLSSEYHGGDVYSLEEYVSSSAKALHASELLNDKYKGMLSKVNYSKGINVHTLDGLDCSGFASWLYNQITDDYEINSTAINFTKQNGLQNMNYGSVETLPGDIFAWTKHIVVVVGKVRDGSKAFVTIEQTPNVLKYGVIYYKGATNEDIQRAKQIACEANELIGGLNPDNEPPHVYCTDTVGFYKQTEKEMQTQTRTRTEEEYVYGYKEVWFPDDWDDVDEDYDPYDEVPSDYESKEEHSADDGNGKVVTYKYIQDVVQKEIEYEVEVEVEVEKTKQYHEFGRFAGTFLDEEEIVPEYGKKIKDMTADEIIQHTLTKLPMSYVTGYNEYKGEIFDKSKVATNLGVTNEEE